MIYTLASTFGWTIDYIINNLSLFQIILLTEASREIMEEASKDKKKDEILSLEEAPDKIAQFFGQDIFEENEVKKDG